MRDAGRASSARAGLTNEVTILDSGLVFVLTILAGGWSIPAGVLLGLNPVGVYVAATLDGVLFTVVALKLRGRLRDRTALTLFRVAVT